jgi:hypothetical protein
MAKREAPVQFRPSVAQLEELARAAGAAGVSVNELAKRRACIPESKAKPGPAPGTPAKGELAMVYDDDYAVPGA